MGMELQLTAAGQSAMSVDLTPLQRTLKNGGSDKFYFACKLSQFLKRSLKQ